MNFKTIDTHTQFQFAQILCECIGLNDGHSFAIGLCDDSWVGTVNSLNIRLIARIQKCIRMATDDNINERTIFRNIRVDFVARMAQRNDYIDTSIFQCFGLFPEEEIIAS